MEKSKLQFQLKKKLHIEIVQPSHEVRGYLKIPREESVFLISQCILSVEDGMPISYNEFYIRKDYFSIDAETVI